MTHSKYSMTPLVIAVAASVLLSACEAKKKEYVERPAESLYNEAMDSLLAKDFVEATQKFDEVERQHPYSQWSNKSQLMAAYSYYLANRYDDAIVSLERFIQLHPTSRDVPYAFYLKGLSYYEQISDVARDQKMTELALSTLDELVKRFPKSKYARDAKLKLDLIHDHLAGKGIEIGSQAARQEIEIGRYYHNQGNYLAAINRFKTVIDDYQTTTHVPEALHRLTEAYLAFGLKDEARKTASVLGYNFPGSEWYLDSYKIMGNKVANQKIDPEKQCKRGANTYEIPRDVCLSFGGEPLGETNAPPQPPPQKPNIAPAQAKDTTPPKITIASAITVKTDSPTIKGKASDNTQVAQVTIEGVAVDLKADGSFTFSRYVPASGTTVHIEAIDEWGNKSQKVVRLSRKAVQTAALSFASLDPTKIKGRSNKDAIALIIGVANYSRAPAATFADNDANVFGDYAHRALGVPRSNIKVLTNDSASLVDLEVIINQWLRGRIEKGKTDVHVFFAGHGLASPDGKDLYLLPYNGETSLLDRTALLRRELFEVISAAKPKSATIFLDTCYSGLSRGKETLLASARGIVVTPKPQSIPKGFTVLSAASGQQISSGLDAAKHGLFSYYLMKGMEGDADANKDRKITAGELHAYLGKRVQRQAIRLGREQTPELSGDGERVLVRW